MSGISTRVEEEPTTGDSEGGNSVASHSQSFCTTAIKEEPDADFPMDAESVGVEFEENRTLGNDLHVKQEGREVVDNFVFIKIEPESCSRFLPEVTCADRVQIKQEWIEDDLLGGFGSSADTPNVDPLCGPIIQIEPSQACSETDESSEEDVQQVGYSEDVPSSSKTSIGGMGGCSKVGLFKAELESKEENRDVEQSFTCYTCSKSFRWKRYLIDHMRHHAGERPYKFEMYESRYRSVENLKKRKMTHTREKPYLCNMCESRFSEAGNLRRHKRTHTGEKPFVCDVCDSKFSEAGHLKRHELIHTGEKPFVCDVCQTRFNQTGHLKKHMRIHTGEKPFVCDVCETRFTEAGHLMRHKRTHTGEKPFLCDVCESRFSRASILKKHMNTHTGDRPFVCDICESRFSQDGHLTLHKRIHTGEKPYMCDVCESRFISAALLKRHKRTHTGEKPYVCDICESRFSQSGSLKRHKKIHSGEKTNESL